MHGTLLRVSISHSLSQGHSYHRGIHHHYQTGLGREYMYAYRSSTSRCAFVSRMYVCMQPRAQQEVDTRCVGCVLLLLLLFSVEPRAERLLLLYVRRVVYSPESPLRVCVCSCFCF